MNTFIFEILPYILVAIVAYIFIIKPKSKRRASDFVYKCGIRGMEYRRIPKKMSEGLFTGFIISEYNAHDKNAIAIYAGEDTHIGFIARWKTDELREKLGSDLEEPYPVFGFTEKDEPDEDTNGWSGDIFIPTRGHTHQLNDIIQYYKSSPSAMMEFHNLEYL